MPAIVIEVLCCFVDIVVVALCRFSPPCCFFFGLVSSAKNGSGAWWRGGIVDTVFRLATFFWKAFCSGLHSLFERFFSFAVVVFVCGNPEPLYFWRRHIGCGEGSDTANEPRGKQHFPHAPSRNNGLRQFVMNRGRFGGEVLLILVIRRVSIW